MKKNGLKMLAMSMIALSAGGLMAGDQASQEGGKPTVRIVSTQKLKMKRRGYFKANEGVIYIIVSGRSGEKKYKLGFGQGLDLDINPCTSEVTLKWIDGGAKDNPKTTTSKGWPKTANLISLPKCKDNISPKGKNTFVILFKEKSQEKIWANVDPKYKQFNKVVDLFKNDKELEGNRNSKGIESYQYNHNDPKNTPP